VTVHVSTLDIVGAALDISGKLYELWNVTQQCVKTKHDEKHQKMELIRGSVTRRKHATP